MQFEVGRIEDLRPGERAVVEVEGRRIAVFNLDGELVAIDDKCAHQGAALADGVMRDGVVTCAAHLWRYDLRTGERTDSSGFQQETFPVTTDGEMVFVDVPEQQAPMSISELMRQHAREWKRDQ